MKTILFVDIDGVFHPPEDVSYTYEGRALAVADGPNLFAWAPILWAIIEPYPVDVVVHSSWRHLYSLDEIQGRFPEVMRHRVVAATAGGDRYQSILDYVNDHGVERFAVLDDMPGAFPPGWPYLIACDSAHGISDDGVQERIRRFVSREPSGNA